MKINKLPGKGLVTALGLACALHSPAAKAFQPYIGQVMCGGWNFAPIGWAAMEGQTLSIAEYEALFALIGTTYGGDGQSTFRLPDMRGRVALHQGQGPGLSNYVVGQTGGTETNTLTAQNLPAHLHTTAVLGSSNNATSQSAAGKAAATKTGVTLYTDPSNIALQAGTQTSVAGGNQPINNLKPTLTINCVIATWGIFPSPF